MDLYQSETSWGMICVSVSLLCGPSTASLQRGSLNVCKRKLMVGGLGCGTKGRCLNVTEGLLPWNLTSAISEMGPGTELWL